MTRRSALAIPLALAVAAGLGACSSAGDEAGANEDASALEGALGGFDTELAELVPTLLDAYSVPGAAVGVIAGGEVRLKEGYGFADVESGRRVGPGDAFNIGSISKTVASWGVLKLVERGELELDAPVSRYLTRWRLPDSEFDHDGVTMRRLLSHTAGLSLSGYPGFDPDEPLPTVEESLSGATNGPGGVYVAHEPGSRWQYSGGGYTIAQLIIEEITGRPFAEYMEDEVLEPLGMTSSSYVWDDEIEAIAATPYGSAGEPIPGPRFTAMAAAGLQTTLDDFVRFALASARVLDGEGGTGGVLRPETVEMMQRPVAPADDYGLGYSYEVVGGMTLVGHGGANEGWMAILSVIPETGDGIVVMTNGTNGGRVHRTITCAWRLRITGEACDPAPAIPVPVDPETLAQLEGRYEIESPGPFELRLDGERLLFVLPDGESSAVLASARDTFFLVRAPVVFTPERGPRGDVVALEMRQGGESIGRAVRTDPSAGG